MYQRRWLALCQGMGANGGAARAVVSPRRGDGVHDAVDMPAALCLRLLQQAGEIHRAGLKSYGLLIAEPGTPGYPSCRPPPAPRGSFSVACRGSHQQRMVTANRHVTPGRPCPLVARALPPTSETFTNADAVQVVAVPKPSRWHADCRVLRRSLPTDTTLGRQAERRVGAFSLTLCVTHCDAVARVLGVGGTEPAARPARYSQHGRLAAVVTRMSMRAGTPFRRRCGRGPG